MVRIHFNLRRLVLFSGLLLCVGQASAKLNVLACEPEWAALAVEIGGAHVQVSSATTAMQDPHHIQARPSLIAKTRKADLIICAGAGLEAGWLPVLIKKSANPKIKPGKPGHLLVSNHVELLGKQNDDNSGIHSQGNPHIHLDPHRLLKVAKVLQTVLARLDGSNSDYYQQNLNQFSSGWQAAIGQWQQQAVSLRNKPVIVHHDSWVYLFNWLGIKQVATLEPKHGVPPSSGYLASLLEEIESSPAELIVRSGYEDEQPSQWLSERSGVPIVTIPFSVEDYQTPGSLKHWMTMVITRLSR